MRINARLREGARVITGWAATVRNNCDEFWCPGFTLRLFAWKSNFNNTDKVQRTQFLTVCLPYIYFFLHGHTMLGPMRVANMNTLYMYSVVLTVISQLGFSASYL